MCVLYTHVLYVYVHICIWCVCARVCACMCLYCKTGTEQTKFMVVDDARVREIEPGRRI